MLAKLTLPFPTTESEIHDGIENEAFTDTAEDAAGTTANETAATPTTIAATNIAIPTTLNILITKHLLMVVCSSASSGSATIRRCGNPATRRPFGRLWARGFASRGSPRFAFLESAPALRADAELPKKVRSFASQPFSWFAFGRYFE